MVAVTADKVVVELEARLNQYNANIAGAERRFDKSMTAIQQSATRAESVVTRAMGRLGGALSGASAIALARQLLSMADAAKNLDAQLKLATSQTGSFAQATDDVRRIAEATRSGLADTATLYGNFARNARDLGITQAEAARATETVAKTFKISGATAVDAAQGTRQLVQALQSGVLRGDEFNSIMESSPRLARLLAESLGVPIGALRAMAEEGDLTSDKLVRAFTDKEFTAGIDAEFKQMPVTFDQAMTQVYNAALITFGAFDKGGEFSTALANFITQGTGGFAELETSAENTGINIRAFFQTLRDAFEPLRSNGIDVAGALERTYNMLTFGIIRDLRSVLQLFDAATAGAAKFANSNPLTAATAWAMTGGKGASGSNLVESFDQKVADRKTALAVQSFREQGMFAGKPTAAVPPPAKPRTKPTTAGARTANAEVGRDWSADEVAALLRSKGVRVTGTDRTAAEQQAQIDKWMAQEARKKGSGGIRPAAVGSSAHERSKGVDIGAETSIAKIKGILKEAGVPIGKLLNEGDHKHLTIGGKGGAGSAEAAARKIETARLAEERRKQTFDNEEAGLQRDLADARSALLNSAELRAQAEKDAIEADRVAYADEIASDVKLGKLRDEGENSEAKRLLVLNDQIAAERQRLVDIQEAARKRRLAEEDAHNAVEAASAENSNQQDLLQSRLGLAETTQERRTIELRLLDLQFEEERIRLRAIIAESERLDAIVEKTEAEKDAAVSAKAAADIARKRLGVLPELKQNAVEGVDRQNGSPFASYKRRLKTEAGDLRNSLEQLGVENIERATDAFGEMAKNVLGVKGAVGDLIAELAKLALKQAILAAIEAYSGTKVKGYSAGGYTGNIASSRVAGVVHGREFVFDAASTSAIGVPALEAMRRGKAVPQGKAIRGMPGPAISASRPMMLNQTIHIDASGSVNPQGYAEHIRSAVRQETAQIVGQAMKQTSAAAPARLASWQKLGS